MNKPELLKITVFSVNCATHKVGAFCCSLETF